MILIKFIDKYPMLFNVINATSKANIYDIYTPCEGVFTHTLAVSQFLLNRASIVHRLC